MSLRAIPCLRSSVPRCSAHGMTVEVGRGLEVAFPGFQPSPERAGGKVSPSPSARLPDERRGPGRFVPRWPKTWRARCRRVGQPTPLSCPDLFRASMTAWIARTSPAMTAVSSRLPPSSRAHRNMKYCCADPGSGEVSVSLRAIPCLRSSVPRCSAHGMTVEVGMGGGKSPFLDSGLCRKGREERF